MGINTIVGESAWAVALRRSIRRVAPGSSTVLIAGPSGTGKELIGRALHDESSRAQGPLIAVDCTSIPATLFPSQLFGHVKGAFSGADCDTLGSFRAADGGTVFLDEIGELGAELQSQLLRVIQERAVIPVGSHHSIPLDVRILTATSRDLAHEVESGRFRLDLYYRLNVIRITTTPLSQRPEDIAPLCRSFLNRWSIENGLPLRRLSAPALRLLMECPWPGNVRQLQNVLERAVVLGDREEISAEDVLDVMEPGGWPAIAGQVEDAKAMRLFNGEHACGPAGAACCEPGHGPWPTLADCECRLIRRTLEYTFYNQSAAARLLGVDWRLLSRKMRRYGITVPRPRARAA